MFGSTTAVRPLLGLAANRTFTPQQLAAIPTDLAARYLSGHLIPDAEKAFRNNDQEWMAYHIHKGFRDWSKAACWLAQGGHIADSDVYTLQYLGTSVLPAKGSEYWFELARCVLMAQNIAMAALILRDRFPIEADPVSNNVRWWNLALVAQAANSLEGVDWALDHYDHSPGAATGYYNIRPFLAVAARQANVQFLQKYLPYMNTSGSGRDFLRRLTEIIVGNIRRQPSVGIVAATESAVTKASLALHFIFEQLPTPEERSAMAGIAMGYAANNGVPDLFPFLSLYTPPISAYVDARSQLRAFVTNAHTITGGLIVWEAWLQEQTELISGTVTTRLWRSV